MTYPTFDREATVTRLRESLETVVWAAKLVPADYTHTLLPGSPTDAWTVTMNIAHLIVYDEGIAIPVLESLVEGENGSTKIRTDNEAWFYNDAVALAAEPLDALLERFTSARMRQIKVAGSFTDADWNRRWSPVFGSGAHGNGPHSPAWVANKTFQHTWEHGNAVLRAALFAPRSDA